jgi:hypothetical protein
MRHNGGPDVPVVANALGAGKMGVAHYNMRRRLIRATLAAMAHNHKPAPHASTQGEPEQYWRYDDQQTQNILMQLP